MRLTETWQNRDKPTLSFELLPARDEKAERNLTKAIDKLVALQPDFIGVTFGAGGSTRAGSYELIRRLTQDLGQQIVAYFAGFGLGPEDIRAVLDSYTQLGVANLLAVRGDPPHGQDDFQTHPQSFAYASDLIRFVKSNYSFCLGAAGYPEGHLEAQSPDQDLAYLKHKVDQGAAYVITNYCYDNQFFFDFEKRARAVGIEVPILPGVMPIFSVRMMEKLAQLCGATVTEPIRTGLAAIDETDPKAVAAFGIDFATQQCVELLEQGVVGLHFYTMDRSKATVAIVTRLREKGLL